MSEYIIEADGHGRLEETIYPVGEEPETHERFFKEPIVRCHDCKHMWDNIEVEYDGADDYRGHEIVMLYCTHPKLTSQGSLEVEPNGFCAWGERMVDEI